MRTPEQIREEYQKLLQKLKECKGGEEGHMDADGALINFITLVMEDGEAFELYSNLPNMWYS